MHSQDEIHDLILRLKDYYPHRADEASDILLHEYNFPMQLAASIMHIVRMLVEKNNCLMWPYYDARFVLFHVN